MLSAQTIDSLEKAAAAIVESQGGQWRRGGAMCRCPAHGDSTPSLSVRVGDTSILFKCFAGCRASDVILALRRGKLAVPSDAGARKSSAPLADHQGRALAIWSAARMLGDSPAERYLESRGIAYRGQALRYHPSAPLGRGRLVRFRPALLAAITERETPIAIQRIFLDRASPQLAGDLPDPRLMLGRPRQGAVRLAEAGPVLGLAEGVETALSASILLGIPVWATLGCERLAGIAIPPIARRLVLLPDADRAGVQAERRARSSYAAQGIETVTLWPWRGAKDWNDILREGGEAGRRRCG